MTTKTDVHSVMELHDRYKPAQRGILSQAETDLIRDTLEIATRNDIELQNVRDVAVMLYPKWAKAAKDKNLPRTAMAQMDAMSAICAVIDQEKIKRGLPV